MFSTFIVQRIQKSVTKKMYWSLLCALMLCLTCSCISSEKELLSQDNVPNIEVDGFSISKMASAVHQLSLAQVSDGVPSERIAYFKAVALLFPGEREEIGQAELERTYLELGPDYRGSPPAQLQKAAEQYLQLSSRYHNIAHIAAKALWYHAWIKADLLHEKATGIKRYKSIVEKYPNEQISQSPTIPWTSINLTGSQKSPDIHSTTPSITWAELACLELIRNEHSGKKGLTHYNTLITRYPQSCLRTHALLLLAQKSYLDQIVTDTVVHEINNADIDNSLRKEILQQLSSKASRESTE